MTGLENARWPLHFSGRGVKNQDANRKVFSLRLKALARMSVVAWEQRKLRTKP